MKMYLKQPYTADELSIIDGFNNTSANKFILLAYDGSMDDF